MKRKYHLSKGLLLIAGAFIIFYIFTYRSVFATMSSGVIDSLKPYSQMTEDEIYALKLKDNPNELLNEIIEIDKEMINDQGKIALIPLLSALIQKYDTFSKEEMIELLENKNLSPEVETSLIKMYFMKTKEIESLIPLLNGESLSDNAKGYMVAIGKLPTTQLENIIDSFDNEVTVIAMKKLLVADKDVAFQVGKKILLETTTEVSNEKLIAALLAVGGFYYSNPDVETNKELISEKLKAIFLTHHDELVRDNAIYALSKMRSDELLEYILDKKDIDTSLKISAVDRNLKRLAKLAQEFTSEHELELVLKAMNVLPILEIGELLLNNKNFENYSHSTKVAETLEFIEKNGMKGVFKYE